jgi:hypothetical protein
VGDLPHHTLAKILEEAIFASPISSLAQDCTPALSATFGGKRAPVGSDGTANEQM